MDGRQIALGTLHRQDVPQPCMTSGWLTGSRYMSRVTGRDYWSDPESVFLQFIRAVGANFIPQWYYPTEAHRRLEMGHLMHEPGGHEQSGFHSPEDVLAAIEALPDDEAVERDFDIEKSAHDYAATINERMEKAGPNVLVIGGFGQADFMGPYNAWGYENYLAAAALYPEAMRRYFHYSALLGRLTNHAIVLARDRHGIAPFVYSGQDICGAGGPLMSPTMLRALYFPELKWCVEPLTEAGIGIIWHCDGDIRPILDDLMDLRIIGLQGFEEEHGVDYAEIVKLRDPSGEPICVWGCVSVTSTLPHGTPEDVRAAIERSYVLAGRARGHILAPTSSILPETPDENIATFFGHGIAFGREFLA